MQNALLPNSKFWVFFPSNFTSLSASAAVYEIFLLTFRAWLRFIPARFLYYPSVWTPFGFQLVSEKLDSSRFSPGLPSRSRTRHAVISHHLHFHHSAPSSSLLLFPSVCLFWCMCVCVNVCLFLFMFVYVGCFGRSGVDCFCLFGGQPTSVGDTHMNLGNFLSTRSWIFVFFPNLVFECTFCFRNDTVVRVLARAQLETRMQARSSYFSPFAVPFQHSQTICWHISCFQPQWISQVKCSHLTTVHTSPGSNFYGLPLFSILVWGFNIFWCHHKRRPSYFYFYFGD